MNTESGVAHEHPAESGHNKISPGRVIKQHAYDSAPFDEQRGPRREGRWRNIQMLEGVNAGIPHSFRNSCRRVRRPRFQAGRARSSVLLPCFRDGVVSNINNHGTTVVDAAGNRIGFAARTLPQRRPVCTNQCKRQKAHDGRRATRTRHALYNSSKALVEFRQLAWRSGRGETRATTWPAG